MKMRVLGIVSACIFACGGFGAVSTIVVATSFVSMQDALADNVSCSTSFGMTNCNGPGGSTSCSTSFGMTNCNGPGGSTSCSTSFGMTNCNGSGGSTSCSTSFGMTNCSGTNGSYSCSESFGMTNCSGSGITYIPKPTPTPTRAYVYTNPTPTPTKKYVYTNPTPTSRSITTKQVCVTSSGLSESCKNYPSFFIEYCSASSGGSLEQNISGTWTKLWTITGTKNSRCSSASTPYYTAVEGELTSSAGISLRVVPKKVNGVASSPDLFNVKIK